MTTQSEVIAIILDNVAGIEINEEGGDTARSFGDLGIDSLDIAGIFLGIQEKLGVQVPDDEIDNLNTVVKIVAYLDANKG